MASSSFSSSLMQATAAVAVVVLLALSPLSEATVDKTMCFTPISNLLPCQDYVRNRAVTPSLSCCTALSQVVQQQPLCLCAILDGEASNWLGINIDLTRALAVPAACLVQAPSIAQCLNVTTIVPISPAPGGHNSAVSTDASLNKLLFFGLLFAASFALVPFKLF